MAKFVGFVGTIRGKVGTTVFTKGEKGLSYGRSYQPQVSNPKTIKQVDQRTKMNLVGRMSQVTPKSLLVGMSGDNNRQRRSNFNRGLLNVATIDRSNPRSIIAKVAPENIVFSEGDEVLHATATTPAITAKNVTLNLTLANTSLAGTYGERVVVAVIKPEDKAGYSYVRYVDVMLDDAGAKAVSITFPQDLISESMVAVYRIPYVLTSDAARYRAQALVTDGVDIIADMLSSNRRYVRGFGRSIFAAKSVFTQA
jgi:hypothetical protein